MARAIPARGVGLLVGLTLVIAAGALLQDLRFDSALTRERAALLASDREFGSLGAALAGLRAAQAGYLATGQDPDFWIAQVNDVSGEIDATIRRRRSAAIVEAARQQYDAASTALGAFVAVDGRARTYVRTDQRLIASDLVFADSIQALTRVTSALDAARAVELAASDERMARLRTLRFSLNAVAIAFVLVVALFFWRALASASAQPEPVPAAAPMPRPAPALPQAAPPPLLTPAVPGLNLADAAALCNDLAKVVDARDVPALFDRAAGVLAAKGAVLWVADPGGAMLRPSLTHGYSERVVAKLSALSIDADNLTSLAYRSLLPQTVNGDTPGSPGAIAVPLVATSGCVGVLAAETRPHKPTAEILPVAQIIAAQLANLVAPIAAPGQKTG